MSVRKQLRSDDGAGTVLTLTAIAVVLALASALLSAMSIFDQWNQAKRVADQAALAASIDILRDPSHVCIAASDIVVANGYLMDTCFVMEDTAVVRVGFIPKSRMAKVTFKRIQVFGVATIQSGL